MPMDELGGDVEAPPPWLSNYPKLKEYALVLVGALELVARTGGRSVFDSLFDRGFNRVYLWSHLLVGRNAEHAQALTLDILLSAARALAQHPAEAGATSAHEPGSSARNHGDGGLRLGSCGETQNMGETSGSLRKPQT